MIANSEADDPESIRHCYVASLVYMYEMSKLFIFIAVLHLSYKHYPPIESNKKDPFRAQVQWYSRIEQLSNKLRKDSVQPPLDDAWELVHEGQRYKGDLSIETIFGKCSVLICDGDEVPKGVGKQKKSWTFFCRFALGPKNSRNFISVKESEMKQLADVTAKAIADSGSAIKNNNNDPTTPARVSTRSRRTSESDSSAYPDIVNTPRSSKRIRQPSRHLIENDENESNAAIDGINTPRSSRRNRQPSRVLASEEKECYIPTESINTPRSSRRNKQPSCLEETLPSPLKNATFSVSSTKTKELCIVIQRCKVPPTEENSAAQLDQSSKVKARKKLDMETTPTKVSIIRLFAKFLMNFAALASSLIY